jgi:hypothetical protein
VIFLGGPLPRGVSGLVQAAVFAIHLLAQHVYHGLHLAQRCASFFDDLMGVRLWACRDQDVGSRDAGQRLEPGKDDLQRCVDLRKARSWLLLLVRDQEGLRWFSCGSEDFAGPAAQGLA